MKYIVSGLESSGKSLLLASMIADIVQRNHKWFVKSGIERPIFTNLQFSDEFTEYAMSLNVPVKYWSNLDELIQLSNCDVVMDEVGNYFDARMWADLSLDVRRWLTQGAKTGVEIYGSAQDFAQVDKSFRRLVNVLLHITKVVGSPRPSATKPPVKFIWGVCMKRDLNPRAYDEDNKQPASSWTLPTFFLIQRKYCEMFDTTQKILRSKPPTLRHEERFCDDPNCLLHTKPMVRHI